MLLRRVILFVLFLATTLPSFGAVAFVQSKSAIATSSSGTVVPTSNVTANNLELVFCLGYNNTTGCSPTGVLGETFVPITSSNNVSWVVYNGTTQIQAYVGIPTSTGAQTISYSGQHANNAAVIFEEWSGVKGVSVLGVLLSASGGTWTITNNSAPITAQAGVALSVVNQTSNITTCTIGTGTVRETQTPSGGLTLCAGDQTITAQTSLSAFSTTWTFGSSGNGSAALLFLEPAASGGGGSVSNSSYAK